jgi:hypothetical protein
MRFVDTIIKTDFICETFKTDQWTVLLLSLWNTRVHPHICRNLKTSSLSLKHLVVSKKALRALHVGNKNLSSIGLRTLDTFSSDLEISLNVNGIAQSVWRWATGWTAWVRCPVGKFFFLFYSIQTGSGAHPASYPMDTGGYFPGGRAGGQWSWPFTSN